MANERPVKIDPRLGVYDASFLSAYMACPRKAFWSEMIGLRPATPPIAPGFGTAIHEALYAREKGVGEDDAIAAFVRKFAECEMEDDKRSFIKGEALLRGYWKMYPEPIPVYGGYLEAEFAISPLNGVTIVGKLDKVINHNEGIWVNDYKTTSSLTQFSLDKYKRDVQMKIYSLAVNELCERCDGVMIDFFRVSTTDLRLEDTVNAKGKVIPANYQEYFQRAEYIVAPESFEHTVDMIARYHVNIQRCFEGSDPLGREGYRAWEENFGECYQWGECPFVWLCEMPERWEEVAATRFGWKGEEVK